MESTFKVETGQSGCYDVAQLRDSLFRITTIRLRALRQFTDHEIRSDQRFSIFLTQCGDLINKIQLKIVSQLASVEPLESIDREQNIVVNTNPEQAVAQSEEEKPKTKSTKKSKKKGANKK